MSEKTVLHKKSQPNAARRLLFLAPIFLANSIFVIARAAGHVGPEAANIEQILALVLGLIALPAAYAVLWMNVMSQRYILRGNKIADGLNRSRAISELVEITGDVGSEADDFRDSIVLKFANGKEISLYVEDYEEKDLLAFLAELKRKNPDCLCTYSDVISLESRGLLRFLVNSVEPDNVILKLSKSPFEDTVITLVKAHERMFWWLFGVLWSTSAVFLSIFSLIIEAERRTGVRLWDPSARIAELQQSTQTGAAGASHSVDVFAIALNTIGDYFTNAGLDFMTTVWLLLGLIALFIPIIRAVSPTFLFVDGKSIGMGTKFLPWESVQQLTLEHGSNSADALEGTLVVSDQLSTGKQRSINVNAGANVDAFTSNLHIDLRRIGEHKHRQLMLRLVDNYARNAQRNDEFMRTTNTLVDLEFTDIWLDSKDQAASKYEGRLDTADMDETSVERPLAGGKYIIKRPLGFGGQGTAYLGRVTGDGGDGSAAREVVIKEVVLPNYADVRVLQDATSRFERGAVLLERLQHPQVVRLWEHFVENGKAYLVLDFIEGKNLRQVIKESGAFSMEQACRFGIQMCDILEYLHSRDPAVVHCDFAPENLMLGKDGKIKLVDFDVAQVMDARAFSFIAGRPAYTPPEQFRGQPTTQSDLFALGGILHFLSNGEDPAPLGVSPLELEGEVTQLDSLIRQCLSFETSERPLSAAQIRSRLVDIVGDTVSVGAGAPGGAVDVVSDRAFDAAEEGTVIKLNQTELSEIEVV